MDSYNRVNPDLLRLLPFDARLLVEIGCGAGALGEQYRRLNPPCRYVGVEPNAAAAEVAQTRLERVVIGSTEQLDIEALGLERGSVDCLIYDGALERARDPWTLLKRHTAWLRPGGEVVACVSNVQHWPILLGMLQGRWDYQAEGLFDRGQLRYFTHQSVRALFTEAGLQVFDVQPRPLVGPQFEELQKLLAPVVKALGQDPQLFVQQTAAVQFVVRAMRPGPSLLRRLLIQTVIDEPIGSARIRVLEPDAYCATIPGVRSHVGIREAENFGTTGEEKVFVLHNEHLDPTQHLPHLRQLVESDYLIVADIDDDPERLPHYKKTKYFDLRCCHGIQTPTEPLADYLRTINPNVAVFANQIAFLPPPRPSPLPLSPGGRGVGSEGRPVTLFFGAFNRAEDWDAILPALNYTLAGYRDRDRVKVRVVHDKKFFDGVHSEAKEFEPTCPYERYNELLSTCDIGLLPLEPTRSNAMKSDLKFLECAARGVVVLASPTAYGQTVVEGETGFLYRTPEEFAAKLKKLIDDAELRHRVATKAYEYVRDKRMLSQHYRRRWDWYCAMRDRLPELTKELRGRVPELFAN